MLQELPTLSPAQYTLVYNMLSFTIATMAASFIFFVMARKNVAPKYRVPVIISAVVVFITACHSFQILTSWEHAYALNHSVGMFEATGDLFNNAYRYVDWLLAVPLLVVELVLVMDLPNGKRGRTTFKVGFAAALMIVFGYSGELSTDADFFGMRGLWGFLSTIPLVYILYVLFVELEDVVQKESEEVAKLLGNTRLLLLFTWGFYPIAYMVPMAISNYPSEAPGTVTVLQVGYAIADILAKAGFGVLIYKIARTKSIEDGFDINEYTESMAAQM